MSKLPMISGYVAPVVLLLLKPGDKSWIRKGLDCDDGKQNIPVVITDTDILLDEIFVEI